MDQRSSKGFWSLICDPENASATCYTGIKSMLEPLSELQKKIPELFPNPPKSIDLPVENNLTIYISNDSEEVIERSADAIRSQIDFPFAMYFFKKQGPGLKAQMYMHLPDDQLYKFSKDKSTAFSWKPIAGSKTIRLATFDDLLPSQVTDRDYVHLPANQKDFEKAANDKGGKWILQFTDWTTLDSAWKILIRLYERGILVALKSCTTKSSITDTNPAYSTLAIMCYTADASCKSSVKRAADHISISTGYNMIMYYKSNEASASGQYRHEGCKLVTKFCLTVAGNMLERDHRKRWKKIIFYDEKDQ